VFGWEWEAAQAMLEQAIALDPKAPEPRVLLAFPLVATGETDSAIASVRAAAALEPYNLLVVSTECWILYLAHRYAEAIERCQFVVDSIDATHLAALGIRWQNQFTLTFLEGEPTQAEVEEAAASILAELRPVEERLVWNEISPAVRLAQLGRSDTARAILEEEIGRPGFRPLRAANVYAAIGDMDEAWLWLERAYEARDPYLAEIAVRPEMAPFLSDPRWPEFARRMNLD
jgi:tetratricopeptide (TPR) repeat protein